jgi:hypothetical protein
VVDLDRLRIQLEINKDAIVIDVERLDNGPAAIISFSCSGTVTLFPDADAEEILDVRDALRRLGILPVDKEVLRNRLSIGVVEDD